MWGSGLARFLRVSHASPAFSSRCHEDRFAKGLRVVFGREDYAAGVVLEGVVIKEV